MDNGCLRRREREMIRDAVDVKVDVDGQRGTLKDKRRTLALALLGNARSTSRQFAPIPPRTDSGPGPLSFSQERLWFLDCWNPGTSVYNVPMTFRLRGALDLAAMQRSLKALLERHEGLRASFPAFSGQPVQEIRS